MPGCDCNGGSAVLFEKIMRRLHPRLCSFMTAAGRALRSIGMHGIHSNHCSMQKFGVSIDESKNKEHIGKPVENQTMQP